LDPSSESEDIAVGTTVELPYWLAQSLCSRRRNIVTVEIPKIYKEPYRSVVKHDICTHTHTHTHTYIYIYIEAINSNQAKDYGWMDGACNLHRETATGCTILVGETAGHTGFD
jgi:hypothetical protein